METDLEHTHVLIAQFSERATPLGAVVERAADSTAAAAAIGQVAATAGTDRVSVAPQFAERAADLIVALRERGVAVGIVESPADARDQPVGLTLGYRAIAETGSVMLNERLLADRAPSLMTIHNVIVVAVPGAMDEPGSVRS